MIVIVLGQARAEVGADVLLGIAAIIGSALCYCRQHRDDAPAGARREAARDQLLPVADGDGAVARRAFRSSACPAGRAGNQLDRRRLGCCRPAGTLLFAWAYARGEASYLAVTEYSAFLWASALGWLVFQRARVALHARRRGADRRRLPDRGAAQSAAPPEIDVAA